MVSSMANLSDGFQRMPLDSGFASCVSFDLTLSFQVQEGLIEVRNG